MEDGTILYPLSSILYSLSSLLVTWSGATMATHAERQPATVIRRRGGWRPGRQNEAYLFLLPSFLGFLIFIVGPVIASLALSFMDWNLLNPPRFVGIANYVALALNTGLRGLRIYRLIYFMPVVSSVVAVALVFQWMFNRDYGIISAVFWWLGDTTGLPIAPPDWLNSSFWIKPAIVLLTVWKNMGFTMVIYLAGLQAVPEELYDAAKVDGAGAWARFRNITLPLISPTTFFLLVIQMIGAFQLFSEPFVMTRGQGGPAHATTSVVFYIYQAAFQFSQLGKASAMAWVLFGFIFACTLIQNR